MRKTFGRPALARRVVIVVLVTLAAGADVPVRASGGDQDIVVSPNPI